MLIEKTLQRTSPLTFKLDGIWVRSTVLDKFKIVEIYEDGSALWENTLVCGPATLLATPDHPSGGGSGAEWRYLPTNVFVELKIFVGGVTFEDLTLVKQIRTADLDALGTYTYRMIRGASVQTSDCHTTEVYDEDPVELAALGAVKVLLSAALGATGSATASCNPPGYGETTITIVPSCVGEWMTDVVVAKIHTTSDRTGTGVKIKVKSSDASRLKVWNSAIPGGGDYAAETTDISAKSTDGHNWTASFGVYGQTVGTTDAKLEFWFTDIDPAFQCNGGIVFPVIKVVIKRDEAGGIELYKPITDANRNVLPGEQMNLKAVAQSASGIAVQGWGWSLPGVVFKDYTADGATGKLTPTNNADLSAETIHFYWADAADNREVKCSLKIGGNWLSADCGKEVMNVKKPESTLTCTQFGIARLDVASQMIGLFPSPGQEVGLMLEAKVTVPTGFDEGDWNFVQLAYGSEEEVKNGSLRRGNHYHEWVLDTQYPYLPDSPHLWHTEDFTYAMDDEPQFWLKPDPAVTESSELVSFRTYVMFRPAGSESRYIPLRFVTWGWGGKVIRDDTGLWNIVPANLTQTAPGASTETSIHPEWQANWAPFEFVPVP